jgi:hypothetical protein
MYVLECSMEQGIVVRMLFASKQRAENARRKIAAEIAKGRFRNDDDVVEIKSDASTYSIAPSRVMAVSVNDRQAWMEHQANEAKRARELGLTVEGV